MAIQVPRTASRLLALLVRAAALGGAIRVDVAGPASENEASPVLRVARPTCTVGVGVATLAQFGRAALVVAATPARCAVIVFGAGHTRAGDAAVLV